VRTVFKAFFCCLFFLSHILFSRRETKVNTSLGEADLIGLAPAMLRKLAIPVLDFVKVSLTFTHPFVLWLRLPPLLSQLQRKHDAREAYCRKSASLKDVIVLMAETDVAQVWVTDENKKVVGKVSIADIVSWFVNRGHK